MNGSLLPRQYSETNCGVFYLRELPTIFYANSVIRLNWCRTFCVLSKMNNHAMQINREVENWIQAMPYMERDGWVVSKNYVF